MDLLRKFIKTVLNTPYFWVFYEFDIALKFFGDVYYFLDFTYNFYTPINDEIDIDNVFL